MSRTMLAASAFVLAISSAQADLIEVIVSGDAATQHGLFVPGTNTLDVIEVDWSVGFVYEDTNEWGTHDAPIVDAWIEVDGVRIGFDAGFDPFEPYDSYQALSNYVSPEFGIWARGEWHIGLEGDRSAVVNLDSVRGVFHDIDGDPITMPIGLGLDDYERIAVTMVLGDAIAGSSSEAWSRGGEWFLHNPTSISARVIPAPASLIALGVLGLSSARRKR